MDIRHLRYFISVANHLNFTKAAEEHSIAQPAMSQLISAMEKQLGTKLFTRNNRSVSLTPAGRVFLEEAKIIVARFMEAVKKTQQAASGMAGYLKIGYWGPYEQLFIRETIKKFRRTYPGIELSIKQAINRKLFDELENGLIDIVFSSPYFHKKRGVNCIILESSPVTVVVYKNHSLACYKKISPLLLANENMVMLEKDSYENYLHMLTECKKNGFTPKIVAHATHYENLLLAVESEIGITLLPRCLESSAGPNFCFVGLDCDMSVDISISWLKNNGNPSIPLLVEMLEGNKIDRKKVRLEKTCS